MKKVLRSAHLVENCRFGDKGLRIGDKLVQVGDNGSRIGDNTSRIGDNAACKAPRPITPPQSTHSPPKTPLLPSPPSCRRCRLWHSFFAWLLR